MCVPNLQTLFIALCLLMVVLLMSHCQPLLHQLFSPLGIDTDAALRENNTYPALKQIGGLIMTGPTGTNVNDVAVALLG